MTTNPSDIQSAIETTPPVVAIIEHPTRQMLLFGTLRNYTGIGGNADPVAQATARPEETLDVALERLGYVRASLWSPGPTASRWSWTTIKPIRPGARRRYAARKYADRSDWYVIDWETGETAGEATTAYKARTLAREMNGVTR